MAIYSPITVARFWSKVDVKKSTDDCWDWTGATRRGGYGGLKIGRCVVRSNRIAWELFNDEDLGDRLALHRCHNPRCCNPHHLYAGTAQDNASDTCQAGLRLSNKLTHDDILAIRRYLDDGVSTRSLGADFGVSAGTISKIKRRKLWAWV